MQESNPPDVLSNRTSADGGIKEVLQQQPKHVAKKPQKHDQLKKEESLEAGSGPGTSKSQGLAAAGPEELSLEMQKMELDEQFKVDSTFKSRSRTASQTSSQSSSSKGSIKSVVKIDSSQSVQKYKVVKILLVILDLNPRRGNDYTERKRKIVKLSQLIHLMYLQDQNWAFSKNFKSCTYTPVE